VIPCVSRAPGVLSLFCSSEYFLFTIVFASVSIVLAPHSFEAVIINPE
jgi:hypothetical protein